MAATRSATAAGTSPASQRLRDLLLWDRRTASFRCFCSAVREEMPWTPMSSSAALTTIQVRPLLSSPLRSAFLQFPSLWLAVSLGFLPYTGTRNTNFLCGERSEGAAGRKWKKGMHLSSEGLTSSFLLDHVYYGCSGACWMVLLEHDGAEALLLQDVMTRRTQRHVWDECKRDGLVLMMTAANGGAPSRPLSPRTRAGTTHAAPPLNAVHPSSDVQVILMRVDSLPAGLNTCNVDMKQAHWRICTGKISFHTIPSKTKVVVFSDELQDNKNAAGYMQASWGTLHKIYMTRKQSHINIDILILLVAAYHNWHQMIVAMKIIYCKELNKKLLYMLLM